MAPCLQIIGIIPAGLPALVYAVQPGINFAFSDSGRKGKRPAPQGAFKQAAPSTDSSSKF